MSKVEKYARIIIKRSDVEGTIPTIPLTGVTSKNDHTLSPSWSTTDIYIGEFFLNQYDERLWIRTNEDEIKELLFIGNGLSYDFDNGVLYANNLVVSGSVSKGSGSFRIPHPDPNKKDQELVHSFVETNTAGDNIYRWKVKIINGEAEIDLPDYYKFLNEDEQIWITPCDSFARAYGYVNDDKTKLKLFGDLDCEYNVLLIATRKDTIAKNNWKGEEQFISK
jgi:hypothetical protein